jgi:hypothetical protein
MEGKKEKSKKNFSTAPGAFISCGLMAIEDLIRNFRGYGCRVPCQASEPCFEW